MQLALGCGIAGNGSDPQPIRCGGRSPPGSERSTGARIKTGKVSAARLREHAKHDQSRLGEVRRPCSRRMLAASLPYLERLIWQTASPNRHIPGDGRKVSTSDDEEPEFPGAHDDGGRRTSCKRAVRRRQAFAISAHNEFAAAQSRQVTGRTPSHRPSAAGL